MSTRLAVAALGVLSLGIIALTVLGVLAYIDLRDRVYAAESSVNDLSSTVYENSNAVYSRLAQLDNLEYQMLDLKDDLEGMQSQVNGIKVLWGINPLLPRRSMREGLVPSEYNGESE